ncbi:MAG: HAD family phosphatase [Lautropia sp.]|nr:HAD family phosphatase [Lautropia sp.]
MTTPESSADTGAIDAVVFDLGGVLVDWNPRYLYRQIFQSGTEMEDFLAKVCSPAWNEQQDRGRPWAEAVRLLQAQYPAYWHEIDAYDTRWEETLRGELPDTVAVLHELRERPVRLLALTNWSQEKFPVARRRFAFLQHFEGILVSGEEKMAKPDAAIFALMASRYHLTPARTVFIDDSEKNVQAARALGWQALHFTGADRLRQQLQALGVL